jgi:hypothetical protein
MAEYRVYFMGHDGQIISQTPLICSDDAEAIAQAKQLVGGFAMELWSGERFIIRLDRKPNDDDERLARAEALEKREFRWIDNFIERLGSALKDIVRKK